MIEKLDNLQIAYFNKTENQRSTFFYEIRDKYNEQLLVFDYKNYNDEWIIRASFLIFLNKTCFNGLFRLNKKGEFNVPFGKYKNPNICDKKNILEVKKALANTEIISSDFIQTIKFIEKNTLIYFDPPYRPINETSNFTSYSQDGFNDEDQKRLALYYKELDETGAYLILSNSDPKNYNAQDNYFDDLYKGYQINRVKANRMINCIGTKRGQISELIITNF